MSNTTTPVDAFLAEEVTRPVSGMLLELLRTRTHGSEELTLDTFHVTLDFDTWTATCVDQRDGSRGTVSLPELQDAIELHRAHPFA